MLHCYVSRSPQGKTSQMSDDHVPAVWRLDKELGIRMSCDITQNKKKNVQMSAQVPKGKQYVKNPETCRNVTRAQPRICDKNGMKITPDWGV